MAQGVFGILAQKETQQGETFLFRINGFHLALDASQATGPLNGVGEVAELIHQAQLLGFFPGVDLAFRQGPHSFQGQLAVPGHIP